MSRSSAESSSIWSSCISKTALYSNWFAKFPPPLWFISAISFFRTFYNIFNFISFYRKFFIRCFTAKTPDALTTKFSNIIWAVKLLSTSWLSLRIQLAHPCDIVLLHDARLQVLIESISSESLNFSSSASLNNSWALSFSATALEKSAVSLTRSK